MFFCFLPSKPKRFFYINMKCCHVFNYTQKRPTKNYVRVEGIGPSTSVLSGQRSTTELHSQRKSNDETITKSAIMGNKSSLFAFAFKNAHKTLLSFCYARATHKILLNFCAAPTRLVSLRLSIASLVAIKQRTAQCF